jgi:adenine deaminase
MGLTRYYHVINKGGEWHLYSGNSLSPIRVDHDQAVVLKAARALVRQQGGKVVVHRGSADAPVTPTASGSLSDDSVSG